jgi:recombination protein recR
MGKNAGKTSAVMQNEDMSMFNAYERENIRRTKAVLDRIEHELRLDRTTSYQVALHEVMAMDKERQTLDAITDCLEKLLPSNFCKDIK